MASGKPPLTWIWRQEGHKMQCVPHGRLAGTLSLPRLARCYLDLGAGHEDTQHRGVPLAHTAPSGAVIVGSMCMTVVGEWLDLLGNSLSEMVDLQ